MEDQSFSGTCPTCGQHYLEVENKLLRAALEPFADIGRPLVKACETGAIPNGASARYLKLDPLIANDFANAATVFDAAGERKE